MNFNLNTDDEFIEKYGCFGWIIVIIFALAIAFGFSCLEAWLAMLLWNWAMPEIWAAAPEMTFWPMWGIVELCTILFKPHNIKTDNE
jgi:hypothetical protein